MKISQRNILSFLGITILLGTTCTIFADGIVDVSRGNIKSVVYDGYFSGNLRDSLITILDNFIKFIRLVLNGVALLMMLYVGFLWVTSMGSEEKTSDGKNRIILIVLGLFLINVPGALYKIFTGSDYNQDGFGTKISDSRSYITTSESGSTIADTSNRCNFLFCPENFLGSGVNSIITILEVAMVTIAVIMFIIGGFAMVLGGSESASETAKRRILYGVIALVITGMLEMIYRAIYFQSNLGTISDKLTSALMTGIKFFIYFAGPIAIISIIVGGYYFITSGGNEEKADKGKKILMYTFFATVMLLLGYTFLIEIIGLQLS